MEFDPKARWIWTSGPTRPYHNFVCFRRAVTMRGQLSRARLRITADSRYVLHVNGHWVGNGPPRSFPSPWTVDEYDLRGLLREGRNVLAVLVHQIGTCTFQYILSDPGLLAQLDWRDSTGEHRLATGRSWRCRLHEGYGWPVPRESVHRGWEEQFDARKAPGADWREIDFADSSWPAARTMCRAGDGEHDKLEARDIPMLTCRRVEPRRVVSVEAVKPAPYTWSLDMKESLNPSDRSSNKNFGRLLVATFIHSPSEQNIQFHLPHGLGHAVAAWKFNGKELRFEDRSFQEGGSGLAHAHCKKGWNCLMGKMAEIAHLWQDAINIWTDRPVKFSAYPAVARSDRPWLAIGPFHWDFPIDPWAWKPQVRAARIAPQATAERYEAIWSCGIPNADDLAGTLCRSLSRQQIARKDIHAICFSHRPVARSKARVDSPAAMLTDNSDWTTIHPVRGADVRLLLDFGREVAGFQEFEIDAPVRTVLDCQNFEFIEPDGSPTLCDSVKNTFRYVCREGVQRYRTFGRRGFRYAWLTLRDFARPVRIRFFRALMNTYPAQQRAEFTCSDQMLQRIWHVGADTVRCCTEDTYVDCPGYEQTHWVIDSRLESLTDLTVTGDGSLSRHCWLQAARSLRHSPLVESQVPSGWRNILPMSSFTWMCWAEELFQYTGDAAFGREAIKYLDRNAEGIESGRGKLGLFDLPASNMLDWAPMDVPGYGTITHVNCLAVLGLKKSADLARQLGDKRRARRWEALADSLSAAANRHLWSAKRQAYIDCIHVDGRRSEVFSQQTQTVAYLSGVAQGSRLRRCQEIIDHAPKGFVRFESPGLMCFVLEALLSQGRYADMAKTIASYWGRLIEVGATTFWETFHTTGRATRSHCHGWSATPTYFLSRYVLGIGPAKPGFAEVSIAPHPSGLAWADGRVPSPKGDIRCRWEDSRDRFSLLVELPEGVPAIIKLPYAGKLSVAEGRIRGGRGRAVLRGNGRRIVMSVRKKASRPAGTK